MTLMIKFLAGGAGLAAIAAAAPATAQYRYANPYGYSEEAEWCFGLSWLAICYEHLGDHKTAMEYLDKATATVTKDGKIPELYFSHSNEANENTPLGWSESMYVAALYEVDK